MRNYSKTIAVCLIALSFTASVHAQDCASDEVKVGEDKNYVYCKKKSIYVPCVKNAGEGLRTHINSCKAKNSKCLEDKGAPLALTTAISACLASALASNLNGCFLATSAGAVGWDWAVAICKRDFGDCMEPGLAAHKNAVAKCGE